MSLAVISPGPRDDQRRLDLGRVRVHAADDALEVQDDVGDVLLDTLDRRELVRDALDADAGDRGAGQRGEQHTAQRVAERVAETAIERLDRERAAVFFDGLAGDSGDLEVKHRAFLTSWVLAPGGRVPSAFQGRARGIRPPARGEQFGLLRVKLDDQLLLHRGGDLSPLGLAEHLRRKRVVVGLEPGRHLAGQLGRVADHLRRRGLR